ncbi:hypothetical protein COU76_01875 [Candidatus Peregrinibacteria bacterium CG10_big_fil_rev_8_21_14_0_10_49_10]|nr:MAG: hypothetical protein COU76_01875 [Candidatus Peregrinibacteria bacterium CG10_big_fil_rev_8_21_14_0_10_49_10]
MADPLIPPEKQMKEELNALMQKGMERREEEREKTLQRREVRQEKKEVQQAQAKECIEQEEMEQKKAEEKKEEFKRREQERKKEVEEMKKQKEAEAKRLQEEAEQKKQKQREQVEYMKELSHQNQRRMEVTRLKEEAEKKAEEMKEKAKKKAFQAKQQAESEAKTAEKNAEKVSRKKRGDAENNMKKSLMDAQEERKREITKVDAWEQQQKLLYIRDLQRGKLQLEGIPESSRKSREQQLERDQENKLLKLREQVQKKKSIVEVEFRKKEAQIQTTTKRELGASLENERATKKEAQKKKESTIATSVVEMHQAHQEADTLKRKLSNEAVIKGANVGKEKDTKKL